jgi:hypothetical protein
MEGKFDILDEVKRQYERFKAQGTQLRVRLLSPPDDGSEVIPDPITHFETRADALFEFPLKNIEDSDMVGIVIQNENTQKDKPIGFRCWLKDQLFVEVIWKLFEKVAQSNAKLNALDPLIVTVHSVKVPVGFGGNGLKSRGRQLDTMAHLIKVSCV